MLRSLHDRHITRCFVALLLAVTVGCNNGSDSDRTQASNQPSTAPATSAAPALHRSIEQLQPVCGVAIVAHHISDLPLYLDAVDQIAELGGNSIIIVTPMFQADVSASEIHRRPDKCPTADQLAAILSRAAEHNLHTTLLPIVLLEEADDKQWRGVIEPDDWDAWWSSYNLLIDWYLDLADRAHIDLLSIGSELNSTEHQLDRWKNIVDRVRARFDGQITYSANWDRYDKVTLWSMVDVISVSSYFEIGRRIDGDNPPSVQQLADAWTPDRRQLLAIARQYDRPLLLSEVGYPSLPWAARHPWNYVPTNDSRTDHSAQANCWQAFFRAWTDEFRDDDSPAAGFYVYAWDPYHHGQPNDTGYGFRGKPAMSVIAAGFAAIRAEPAID